MAVLGTLQVATGSFAVGISDIRISMSSIDTSASFIFLSNGTPSTTDPSNYFIHTSFIAVDSLCVARAEIGTDATCSFSYSIPTFTSGVTANYYTNVLLTTTQNTLISEVNTSQSFIIHNSKTSKTAFNNDVMNTTFFFRSNSLRSVGQTAGGTANLQVIDYSGCSVQRGITSINGTNTAAVVSIAAVDTSKSIISFSMLSDVLGDMDQFYNCFLRGATTLIIEKAGTANTVTTNVAWEVISFNDGTFIESGSALIAGAGNTSSPVVNLFDTSNAVVYIGGLLNSIGAPTTPDIASQAIRYFCRARFVKHDSLLCFRNVSVANTSNVIYYIIQFNTGAAASAIFLDSSYTFFMN